MGALHQVIDPLPPSPVLPPQTLCSKASACVRRAQAAHERWQANRLSLPLFWHGAHLHASMHTPVFARNHARRTQGTHNNRPTHVRAHARTRGHVARALVVVCEPDVVGPAPPVPPRVVLLQPALGLKPHLGGVAVAVPGCAASERMHTRRAGRGGGASIGPAGQVVRREGGWAAR